MFVIDASVVASWCFPDEAHSIADAAFARIAMESATAPVLFWFELRNVLLIGERRSRLSEVETARFLKLAGDLPIDLDHTPDSDTVFRLARTHKLSIYDAAYLELAHRKAAPLATLDAALIKAARAEKVWLLSSEK